MRFLFVLFLLALMAAGLAGCGGVRSGRWYDSERDYTPADKFFKDKAQNAGAAGATGATGAAGATGASGAPHRQITVQQAGDSYYALARRHNVSVRALIAANQARPPYRVQVGQTLNLPQARFYVVREGDTLYGIANSYTVSMAALARLNRLAAPYRLQVGQKIAIPSLSATDMAGGAAVMPGTTTGQKQGRATGSGRTAGTASTPSAPAPIPPSLVGRFIRPVDGEVISTYGAKSGGLHNDGINIAIPLGTDIRAAENGVIVYRGNELEGYGNLMLIRHAGGYVTAYAHLNAFQGNVGERVTQGQIIAKSGQSGNALVPQLHFEIRKGTQAIDPQKLI